MFMVMGPSGFLMKRLSVGLCAGSWDLGKKKRLLCEFGLHTGYFLWSLASTPGVLKGRSMSIGE